MEARQWRHSPVIPLPRVNLLNQQDIVANFAVVVILPSIVAAKIPAGITADVQTLPASASCTSLAAETVTTTARMFGVCRKMRRRFVCPQPTRTCSPGEPTQKPYPSETVTADCTPTVKVHLTCGCPSCTAPAATATATATATAL